MALLGLIKRFRQVGHHQLVLLHLFGQELNLLRVQMVTGQFSHHLMALRGHFSRAYQQQHMALTRQPLVWDGQGVPYALLAVRVKSALHPMESLGHIKTAFRNPKQYLVQLQ
jgi:hypothetical protein